MDDFWLGIASTLRASPARVKVGAIWLEFGRASLDKLGMRLFLYAIHNFPSP
jgi:hypothetical protein